jgi:hypothetical protein
MYGRGKKCVHLGRKTPDARIIDLKVILMENMGVLVGGSCEHDNGPLGYVQSEKFLG